MVLLNSLILSFRALLKNMRYLLLQQKIIKTSCSHKNLWDTVSVIPEAMFKANNDNAKNFLISFYI